MSRPLLLLDVDGVLAPFSPHTWKRLDEHYPGYSYDYDAQCHLAHQINGDRIRRLMESFEVIWCTGWENEANNFISPAHDLPDFPVIPLSDILLKYVVPELREDDASVHWKQGSIESYVEDRPYAFVDDEIGQDGIDYAEARNESIPTLWVATDCQIGLTDEHVERLEEFAQACDN